MPYDYSFYAGGANDVRGWRASALGPGSYKYYIDTNGTSIQVGDIRLAGSAEYRFQFNKKLKGAFFIDAGNIWTIRTDNNRLGSKFSGNWFKEIAVAPGIGIRRDFDFFIVRVDFGFPVHNPSLPTNERWIFQKHNVFNDEVTNFISKNPTMTVDALKKIDPTPFTPHISFGIGYPF
jgi:outer membrane protein assembly factor BamA